ncbi:MAG: hypothetical protein JWM21_1563 [Acidobacteria bacterium]|nr:hypothetical protein [Acidobacteriota bacterium]
MNDLFVLVIFLVVFFTLITLIGHGIWILLRWLIRQLTGRDSSEPQVERSLQSYCSRCQAPISPNITFCGHCGAPRPSNIVVELLKDLAATERQLVRFRRAGAIQDDVYDDLKNRIQAERTRLGNREAAPPVRIAPAPALDLSRQQPASVTDSAHEKAVPDVSPSVVVVSESTATSSVVIDVDKATVRVEDRVFAREARVTSEQEQQAPPPPRAAAPRKPFTEVLAAFMEQSNIRWGEIIGGLLIIGCSTALVVSLWAQISSIPVLKFLIFTTVTAALFGVGLYTEHRWKLPTTSRGILTIATLLVPLNFLAIAAVSGGTIPPGSLVIGSELIAPALFLCLVYFAGRVITPKWPHLLAAGVLGSSVGQLLIRHFAASDNSPELLLALGAFPVICYAAAAAWMLWIALADSEIDESETGAIFITLGALTFAALLPFGLLLYKSGPVSMTMMYLAPLVTLGGVPMLASGTLLWKRVLAKELAASRTAGTSIGIIGTMIVISGMILAWPNPASIVPAALLNFAVLTALAVLLELSFAHFVAAICFSLAYVVLFHVLAGHVPWQNLRIVSLLDVTTSVSSGQALVLLFALFVVTSEWLAAKKRSRDSVSYLFAACAVAITSLLYLTEYGFDVPGDPYGVWICLLLYALGAFWLARRRVLPIFTWIGAGLLLFSLFQALGPWLGRSFPWQTAMLIHASVCACIAIIGSRYCELTYRSLVKPLNSAALVTSFAVLWCLLQANNWETTAMQAERVFWIAGIWMALLWLNRDWRLFTVFQIALTGAVVLAIKASLQQYEWYAYLPHAFLHPTALQIQTTALVMLSLTWVGVRYLVSDKLQFVDSLDTAPPSEAQDIRDPAEPLAAKSEHWTTAARRLLKLNYAFDRLVTWAVLGSFALLVIYGVFSGVRQELTALGSATQVWNIVGFPHQEALGPGSWILLGLLVIVMLANLWERRHADYLLGAVVALALICPLLAGRWETQIATASAWRWFAAIFLVVASTPVWFREWLGPTNFSLSWSGRETVYAKRRQTEVYRTLVRRVRILLLATTLTPLLVLTAYPALRSIYYLPVHGSAAGIFYVLGDRISYSIPLLIAALALVAYALRERLVTYAFAAGLLFNVTLTMVYLLSVVSVQASMDRVVSAHVLYLNAIAAALYAIVWLSMRPRWLRRLPDQLVAKAEWFLGIQVALAIAADKMVIVPVAIRLADEPGWAGVGTWAAGSATAWLALALTTIAAVWFGVAYQKKISALGLSAFLLGTGCLSAFTVARWNPAEWSGFHALLVAAAVAAWLMCLARLLPSLFERRRLGFVSDLLMRFNSNPFSQSWQRDASLMATCIGGLSVVLALRVAYYDPGGPWWSIGTLITMSGLAASLNWQTLRRGYLYAAGILVGVATFIWWTTQWAARYPGPSRPLDVIVSALCLSSVLWLALELRARRKGAGNKSTAGSFHNLAAVTSLSIMAIIVALRLLGVLLGFHASDTAGFDWLAVLSLTVLMIGCIWDERAKYAVAGLYLTGLIMIVITSARFELRLSRLVWALLMMLATYALSTSVLWRRRERIISGLARLGIPRRLEPNAAQLRWLSVFNLLLIAAVVALTYLIDYAVKDKTLRLSAALAVAIQAFTFNLLTAGDRKGGWKRTALAVFVVGLVFFGWGWLVPGLTDTWLNRAVILMVEMFGTVALFGLELDKVFARKPEWANAIRACVPWLTGVGLMALIFVLCTEVFYQIEFGAVRVSPLALVTVGVTLAAASIICILFALSPKHDPLNLSEKRRRNYVYVAEVMVALLFMHIRLTMPWLFTGFFERYWPIVVVAIAYVGVAASELLRRRGVLVLAHPIERTGVFLPLLPVLGFWLTKPEVDYSVLLFIIGGLYGLVSILRQSFVFGILAVLAGNGGLWYLWHRTSDLGFLQHPQLWLIPVAGSVLIAAYLNRDDFSEEQMIGIRYLALITIYASSTADIFINGVARSPWLPMILAALSLAGVFGGIMLRIQAFLLLGSLFLLLAITTMIYYASANLGWTWLWYVAGIVTGAMIIFTFALFEKKRDEMLRVVEGLKEWER